MEDRYLFKAKRLDKNRGTGYTKKAVHVRYHGNSDETRSYAMEIYEPCQVGNKAALNRISRVPQGCLAELTVKVTLMEYSQSRSRGFNN